MAAFVVPEHSLPLLEALSGGKSFVVDSYPFVVGEDWLMAIGYPQEGEAKTSRLEKALQEALHQSGAKDCFLIAPELPPKFRRYEQERDVYYTLSANAPIPSRLRGPVRHARERLLVNETREFTAEHRRLWREFMGRIPLPPRIRQLYASTASALRADPHLRLLNAWDGEGHLAACLVLEYSLPCHVGYILGAHSKAHYTPHAPDLLFAEMLERARAEGKTEILLGLGVNEGITRFKRKWGGVEGATYHLASWQEEGDDVAKVLMQVVMGAPGVSKWKFFDSLPEQREYAMLWRLEKNGRTSWIGGSAHFFCCSFELSLRRLFEKVDTVLLEGPIDSESMDEVARIGRSPEPGADRVINHLTEEDIRQAERMVYGPEGLWARILGRQKPRSIDVRDVLQNSRQWYAFFSLWTAFLERNGWDRSVDMEVWDTALDMNKSVMGMESLAEQIASLESAPMDRIARFIKGCRQWPKLMRRNRSRYLAGDLVGMMGTSAEFPTRTGTIISARDQRFRERMRPYIERGGTAVFVGTAHMVNLRPMLAEDGFTVTRELPTLMHKFSAWIRKDSDVVLAANPRAPVFTAPQAPAPALERAGRARAASRGPSSGRTLADIGARAFVPEQIPAYVRAVSGQTLKNCEGFAAWTSPGHIVLVAFPTDDESTSADMEGPDFAVRLERAVSCALAAPEVKRITVLAPTVPRGAPKNATITRDAWWRIPLPHLPGQKLRNMIRRAERDLSLTREPWGEEHDALVDHYLKVRILEPGTRHIFGRVRHYVETAPESVLLSARDASGALKALAVGEYSSLNTAFYMFAFRHEDCPPGGSDALLFALCREAQERGQSWMNLGLGIDGGITFFKKKWKAELAAPHVETSWSL